ncbi:MAG: ribonuclease P protein component [Aeromicrobium sp.]|nr:MAG: ribonuclease P protein component [Aeromicrobium sp.]
MLPATHRMRDGDSFRQAIRGGVKAARTDLVVHLNATHIPTDASSVGFVVSKAVGNAVVRNRVKRQLRHSMKDEIQHFSNGYLIVVRAFPSASQSDYLGLQSQVHGALASAQHKLSVRGI